ncbi:unnamed protein product [Blepharisma stoltei]|uniref:Uncharacterized protein n=1 Tax=Blepharisma stoltei TaxID=1481888 RepID=A0AAU9ISW6_9CILI|nr:unnamed protein product [Blepharisma stoltei]
MKHFFHKKEVHTTSKSRVQELEEELQQAYEQIRKLQIMNEENQDEEESKDLKSKLRIMTTKFANVRKERDTLKKENKQLQTEIMELQSHIRHMVPGFQNSSNTFPLLNELGSLTDEFYKCDCQDLFFEVLSPELSIEGIIYFFRTSFSRINDFVNNYFSPTEDQIKRTTGLESLDGPILNVLRKSYQVSWKRLANICFDKVSINRTVEDIQRVLNLGKCDNQLVKYLKKLEELVFCYYISDPPLTCPWESIGEIIQFNSLLHDAIDGFVRPGDQCYVLLPIIHKYSGEVVAKAGVLHIDYELN